MRAVVVSALLIGCAAREKSDVAQAPMLVAPRVNAAADAGVPETTASPVHPAVKADRCPPPGPGKVSDDDTPVLRGGKEQVRVFDWLDARGVSKTAAIAWYVRRHGGDPALAEITFGEAFCQSIVVGDAREDAMVCEDAQTYLWMRVRALVLAVRNKQIVPLLEVGLGMRSLDFPDARHLDLALTIDDDGKSITLADRAPEGTLLVEPPSFCREREADLDACEAALAKGDTLPPACPTVTGTDGKRRIEREPGVPSVIPAEIALHDCDAALPTMRALQKEIATADSDTRKQARDALGFLERTCKERGRYVWSRDRFVR